MTTAFSATKVFGPHCLGPKFKVAGYKLQLPSSSTAAGEALDLSSDFGYIYGAIFGNSGAAADHGYKLDLIGTYASTGVVSSGVSLVEHWNAETAAAMGAVTNATDLKAVDDMFVLVFGN
jgi:hypothetical protein